MVTGLTIASTILAAPVASLTFLFTLETLAGLKSTSRPRPVARVIDRSAVIVVPAHNEALVISETLAALNHSLPPNCRLLVIADNCGDGTADLAKEGGAEVIERSSASQRGKGYALAFARDALKSAPPEAVLVMDADCRIDRESIRALVSATCESGLPAQAANLLFPNLRSPPLVQLSSFAFFLKNVVRQRGLQRLTGRAHLTGTGMAFTWGIFETAPLASSDIVEDLLLGISLSLRGLPPIFVPDASVWSPAAKTKVALVQRERWEGGHLQLLRRSVPRLMRVSMREKSLLSLLVAIDLSIPPLALLVMLNLIAGGVALIQLRAGGSAKIVWLVLIPLIGAGAGVIGAWLNGGRKFASAAALLRVPFYLAWKLPLYLRLLVRGAPKDWLRTGR